jgi:hypothetical protein
VVVPEEERHHRHRRRGGEGRHGDATREGHDHQRRNRVQKDFWVPKRARIDQDLQRRHEQRDTQRTGQTRGSDQGACRTNAKRRSDQRPFHAQGRTEHATCGGMHRVHEWHPGVGEIAHRPLAQEHLLRPRQVQIVIVVESGKREKAPHDHDEASADRRRCHGQCRASRGGRWDRSERS